VACPEICGEPVDDCNGVTWEGCCAGNIVRYCEDGELKSMDCADDPSCGWDAENVYYACGMEAEPDPDGVYPMDCDEICTPDCGEQVCGDDGCGGDCGACPEGEVCTPTGVCCIPSCEDKICGDDGCGGDCGACLPEEICEAGACVPGGCQGIPWEGCCQAGALLYCDQGNLIQESCAGDPDCGWSSNEGYYNCGTEGGADPADVFPMDCMVYCVPDCAEKECGGDGCDGSCGECTGTEVCVDASCIPDPCDGIDFFGCCDGEILRWCQDNEPFEKDCTQMTGACGWSEKGGEYNCGTDGGEDPGGEHLRPCPGSCVPDCGERVCGDDGCEGSCGVCDDGVICEDGSCVPEVVFTEVGPDTVATTDAGGGGGDTAGTEPIVMKKSTGGCALGTSPAPGSWVVFVGLLMLLARLARFKILVLVLMLAACTNSGGSDSSPEVVDAGPADSLQDIGPADSSQDFSPGDADLPDLDSEETHVDMLQDFGPEAADSTDAGEDVASDLSPEPPFDCDSIPDGPFELTRIEGAVASEDLAFDGLGHLVGSNNQAIYKSTADGEVGLLAPDVEFRSGMRYLPNGLLAVNDNYLGRVLLVDPDGVVSVLVTGLSYPNGMTVDKQGYIYVTEHDAGRVLRIHSYTGEYTVLTEEINNPNGITFNNAYDTLYIGSFGASAIYTMSISPDGVPGRLEVWADFSDTPGLLDGMGVDICGNVYVCEYGATDIWRVSPDGQEKEKIIIGGPLGTYLPNLQWGRGPGWDPMSLYIPDGWEIGVWRAEIGVPSKHLAFPPGG